jgi:hypothetical protein
MENTSASPDEKPATAHRYRPVKLRGNGPTASEMVIRDRDRFWGTEQLDKTAPEADGKQSADRETKPRV